MEYQQPLLKYPHSNNSLLSSGNVKKSTAYEPRTEAISPAMNDDIINAEDSTSRSTKDEQTLIVEKLKKVEAEIVQTDLQIVRLRRQKEQLEQAQAAPKADDDQENVCDTKQLSIAKLVYHENRAKAQKAYAKLECLGGSTDLPIYNQPSDNVIYHHNTAKFSHSFKKSLIDCFRLRFQNRLKLEDSVSTEYDRRMEKWLKSIELEDSQPSKRMKDAERRAFFDKQFPELKKARESSERFSRVGQRVARSDAEVDELLDGIMEREDQDKKVKSYAVIPPMLEEMRSKKPKFINTNGYVEDIVAEYKEYQILNTWTDEEKEIFKENYLQHPKNFGLIARMTGRKTVADCVQYYYLSKKSENYKGLLKRQQRRRTRSLVRPAAATPANNELIQNDTEKTNGVNDNQAGGDAVTNDINGQHDGSKSSAFTEQVDLKKEACDINMIDGGANEANATCCVCNCDFSDSNQFRNVTRSNHQLYGIALDAFRPGMKICYPCRFRHVKHPNFDEPTVGMEVVDNELAPGQHGNDILLNSMNIMEVDRSVVKADPDESHANQVITGDLSSKNNIPTNAQHTIDGRPPNDLASESVNNNSGSISKQANSVTTPPTAGPNKTPLQRTCVRDIIYQAIEMSFRKPTDSIDPIQAPAAPKPELKPEIVPANHILPQHLVNNAVPPKPVVSSHTVPNPLPPHIANAQNLGFNQQHQFQLEMQRKQRHQLIEFNIRQHQLQAQMQERQFSHPSQYRPPQGPTNSPPAAHGVLDLRGASSVDEGVLNLSARSEKPKSPEPVVVAAPAPVAVPPPPISAPVVVPVALQTPVAMPAPVPVCSVPNVVTAASAASTTTATTTPATTTLAVSAGGAPAAMPAAAPNPPTPKQETNREDSRSPSEMVIDESADAPSPES